MSRIVRWVAGFLILLMVAAAAELSAFAVARLAPQQFRQDLDDIRRAGKQQQYEAWLRHRYDAELGWINPRSQTVRPTNCAGEVFTTTFDQNGARWSHQLDRVDIIVVGDSFTRGDEVDDLETYPHWIHRLTGLGVANYGVGATGPLQQVMYLERLAPLHPEFRIAILGIMYENLRRMPVRLRFVFNRDEIPFYFKPYLDVTLASPEPRPNPNVPSAANVRELEPRIEEALRSDYLSRPVLSFPYTFSVLRLLWSRQFIYGLRNRLQSDVLGWYEDENLLRGLDYVVRRFAALVRSHDAMPVVVFIPGAGAYLDSPTEFIRRFEADNGDDVLFVNVGEAAIDWARYNVRKPDGTTCHATAYGYEVIGRTIVHALAPHLNHLRTVGLRN